MNFTKSAETAVARMRCAWCRRAVDVRPGPGRPRRYCRESCRQMAYQARRRAKELRLGEDELVLARHQLDELRDALFVLQCAVEDVERDLAGGRPTAAEVREALDWLLDAARPAAGLAV